MPDARSAKDASGPINIQFNINQARCQVMGGEPPGRSYSTGGALKAERQEVAPQSLAPGQAMLSPPHRLRSECYRDPLKGSSANTLGTDEVVRSREAGRLLKTKESPDEGGKTPKRR